MEARALRPFRDAQTGEFHARGERFGASPERVGELVALGIAEALEKMPAKKRARKPKE